ncbi:MAG: hypothetical protein M3N53_10005 [Actinomycetota bacterium]|nr:hypothetical protein [Actinomycetota bacterium]
MATTTLTDRAQAPAVPTAPMSPVDRVLGKPPAYVLTALVLLSLFAWPFISDQDRVAPTRDPAFYTWRIEALMTEEPARLLEIEGPNGMFAAGYRVTAPVLGAFLRQIPEVAQLSSVTFMMVGLPVLTALLLAGFAYRERRDPVMFHAVAFAAGGLMLTPPFVGYLDNILVLFFLAAALPFLAPSRESWPARLALGLLLLLCGLTHPTTLVIFSLVLGVMAVIRLVVRRFDLRSVIRDDGPMLVTAFVATVLTVAIWIIGIWGRSVSLAEAALLPPYGVDFFLDRLLLWVNAMRPLLNGPLLVIGLVGLLAKRPWQRLGEDDLTRVSVAWLAPLVGIFGFLAGVAYTYYRFFNTTLAWVLLVGVGAYFALRFFIDRAQRGGVNTLAWVGVLAVLFILATNFTTGFRLSGWTNPNNQWMEPQTRKDMDALRAYLSTQDPDRPVVFVVDDEPPQPFQIYAFAKLTGNTSRYGLPPGMIDQGYLYLGSLENYLAGEPTEREGNRTYDELSPDLLDDVEKGIARSGQEPIVVLASTFNEKGANAEIAAPAEVNGGGGVFDFVNLTPDVVMVDDGAVTVNGQPTNVIDDFVEPNGPLHLVRLIAGLLLLLIPGFIAFKMLLPDGELPEALGMVPALSAALLSFTGIVVIAVARGPFTLALALVSLVLAAVIASLLGGRSGSGLPFTPGGRAARA